MDIDSLNFDAKGYVLNILRQSTIKQLIKKNNEVDQEIKIHDHEIQSLVFENYSKFISSIDTVRQMKDNICMVDDKLKMLDNSMQKIQSLALKIDSTFSVKRKEIQKLDTINKDLQKLKNLCDFPNILKQDLNYWKSIPENKINQEIQNLFNKSIQIYQCSFQTLIQLQNEPLIAPIYKQALSKVEQVRSILKSLQVQIKNKVQSKILQNITKKLLIITNDQVSILRIYFHSWKQRMGESCFLGNKILAGTLEQTKKLLIQMNKSQMHMPEINEKLWSEFIGQFTFIYEEIYSKLNIKDEQIQLLTNNHTKQIFLWALNNYIDSTPQYCLSLKGYVQVNHIITGWILQALNKIKLHESNENKYKLYTDLSTKMQQKLQWLGNTMLDFVFGRVKIYLAEQVIETKLRSKQMKLNEQILKESYIKLLNPLKDTLNYHYKLVLEDIEFLKNSYENIFISQEKYQSAIHQQIQNLIKTITIIFSHPSSLISQQLKIMINKNYNNKLNKIQKSYIEKIVQQLNNSQQSNCWFIISNTFLLLLNNHLGKKIIQSAHRNIEITKNHNYAHVFNYVKFSISSNLIALATYFTNEIVIQKNFASMITPIINFVQVLNIIFPDSRRNIMKKPSFLSEENNYTHQTEILTAKKLRLFQNKQPCERVHILTYFIRKLLKQCLSRIRLSQHKLSSCYYEQIDIYCLVQICYELSNVDDEAQICAFYHFILQNDQSLQKNTSREKMEQYYAELRKNIAS